MKSKIIQQAKNQVKLNILISAQKLQEYLDLVFQRFAPQIEIKGFRAGKAPKRMIIEKIGSARINQEVMDMAIRQNLIQAVADHKLSPVTSPRVNLKKWTFNPIAPSSADVLEYEAEFGLMPEVKLGDYKKIRLPKSQAKPQDFKATDQEVEIVLKRLQDQKAKLTDIDRAAKNGDWAEIEFEGKYQGVVQEKLASSKHPLILGSKSLIPGFEDELIGLKKGESKKFKLKLPENFRDKNLAGKEVEFEVKINQLKKVDLPPLDDSFAANFGHKSIADLKAAIGKSIVQEKKQKHQQELERQVLDRTLKLMKADVPESLVDQEVGRQIDLIKQNISRQGMNFEKYLQTIKKTPEDLQKEIRPQAKRNIKIGLMLGEVVKKEGWDPKDKGSVKKAVDRLVAIATDVR